MDKKTLAKEAFMQFREGQLDHALAGYRQIKDSDPADANTLILIGDILAWKGNIAESLASYREAFQGLLTVADAEKKRATVKNKIVKLDPDFTEELQPALSDETKTQQESPENSQMIRQLKGAVAADPKNFENYQKFGDFLAKIGKNSEAAEQYLVIGNALYNNRMFQKAGAVFQRIIKLDPACLHAHIALGEIYAKEGADSDAKKEYLFAAEIFIRQGNLERGQQFAQKAIQLKSIEAHYYLGLIFYQNRQLEEARAEFETLLKFKVNHLGGLTLLAQIELESKHWDEASGLYERLVKKDAKDPESLERLAQIALQQNNPSQAAEYFVRAMDAYAANEEWERAAISAYAAVKLDPGRQELYLKLADAAYTAGLEEQAAQACRSLADLLDADGKADQAEAMRAKAREITGEAPAPIEAVKPPQARPEQPVPAAAKTGKTAASVPVEDELQVLLNMADNCVHQGSLDEAIEIYQKILKSDPGNEKVKNLLTRVYAMFAGVNPETAVTRKVTAPAPGSVDEKDEQRVQREARERALREAQVRTQRSATASEAASVSKTSTRKDEGLMQSMGNAKEDEIAGDNQDEFMTVTVAEIYTKQGLLNEALKIYQKILEIEPGNMEAQVKKQELEKKMVEQEKLSQQPPAPRPAPTAGAGSAGQTKSVAEPEMAPPEPKPETAKPAAAPDKPDKPEEPPTKNKRGRVSYV